MKKHVSSSMSVYGFTLLELLITIAIIAILAGMLLPMLNKARDKGKEIKCIGNIKQLALAWSGYADDYGGRCIPTYTQSGWTIVSHWSGEVKDEVVVNEGGLNPYLSNSKGIRACPAHPSLKSGGFTKGNGGYGYSTYVGAIQVGSFCEPIPASLSMIKAPSSTVVFGDNATVENDGSYGEYNELSAPTYPTYPGTPVPSMQFRHDGKAAVAWADGHSDSQMLGCSAGDVYNGRSELEMKLVHKIGWFGYSLEEAQKYFSLNK